MRKMLAGLALAVCCALVFSGCSTLSFGNANDLLRAPELSEEPGAIQRALTAEMGEVEYKYPKEGDNHSPLLLADLDGDGEVEGIVFYSTGEGNNNVRIAVLKQQAGAWTIVAEAPGANTEVASVDVADMYGDGTQLLIVGYANASLGGKTLELYEYTGDTLDANQHGSYNSYLLDDFTGRGGTDLAVVSRGEGETGLFLQLITGREGEIRYLQEGIALVGNIATCVAIHTSVNAEGQLSLVLDGTVEASGYLVSQVLVYSETTGQFYVRENENAAAIFAVNDTLRASTQLTSRDIDGDGVVETPVTRELAGDENIDEELPLYFVQWMDFTAEEPVVKYYGLFDTVSGLYTQVPEGWQGAVRVNATETGWRMRQLDSARTLLEYRELETGEELPEGAWYVAGNVNACLIPASSLNAVELLAIDTYLLV